MAERNLDLLLVHPSLRNNVYQGLANELSAIEPPYLDALTASYIRDQGFGVEIIDSDALNLSPEETARRIEAANPRMVQIIAHGQQPSASTQIMPSIRSFVNAVKDLNPERRVLLTGNHPSALPLRTMQEERIDFIGRGEAYDTSIRILQSGGRFDKVPGLFFRDKSEIKFSGVFENSLNSEELTNHFPKGAAWDLLPMDKYRAHNWHCFDDVDARKPYASIYTSFGCGMGCDFCMIDDIFTAGGTVKSKIRTRGTNLVVDEIETLVRNYGVKNIKFIDEMFVFDKRHYEGIARELIKRDLGNQLNIWAYARIDTVRKENLDLLKKAGISWLGLGIESGNTDVRKGVQKGKFDDIRIEDVVKTIQSSGINAGCNYIFGLTGDNSESMQATLDLALRLNGEYSNFYSAMAYPGSRFHKEYQGKGVLPEDNPEIGWIGYSQHAYKCLPLPTDTLSPADILRFRDNAFHKYFEGSDYLSLVKRKFGERALKHVKDMTTHRLKRKILGD